MVVNKAAHERLRRLFSDSFSVGDIAEPLVSFDAGTPAAEVLAVMDEHRYAMVGVRRSGAISGFVRKENLLDGHCGDYEHPFEESEVVADSACLPTVVARLVDKPQLFVTSFGRIGGIVSRTDLQKPPVRMWLFGMVTIVEMSFMRLIESKYPEDTWKEFLSDSRLEKANTLLAERKRRNQDLDLIDCLQFSDKGQIIVRDRELRDRVGFVSRRRGDEVVKRLEMLRNNLAHSQDVVSGDWEIIVGLAENLDRVIAM